MGFGAFFFADDGASGVELWRTNGKTISLAKDFTSGAGSTSPVAFGAADGRLLTFIRPSETAFTTNLWTNTSADGITPLDIGIISQEQQIIPFGNRAIIVSGSRAFSAGLTVSNGTTEGTSTVLPSFSGYITSITVAGDRAFFIKNEFDFSAGSGFQKREVWETDGTIAGTRRVPGLNDGFFSQNQYVYLTSVGDNLVIQVQRSLDNVDTYLYDADEASLVRAASSGYISDLVEVNGSVFSIKSSIQAQQSYLSILDLMSQREIVKIANAGLFDLISAGNKVLIASSDRVLSVDVSSGIVKQYGSIYYGNNFTKFEDKLYFSAGLSNGELWSLDPSTDRVQLIKTFFTDRSPLGSALSEITVIDGKLVFSVSEPVGHRLWTSDGTSEGTSVIDGSRAFLSRPTKIVSVDSSTIDFAAPTLTILNQSTTSNADRLILTGVTDDGNSSLRVRIFDNTTLIATASPDRNGFWQANLNLTSDQTYSISARATDPSGNEGRSATFSYTLDRSAPKVTVNERTGFVANSLVAVSGSVDVESFGRVVSISNTSAVLGTALAGLDGSWTTTVQLHGYKSHSLVASTTDPAGNTGSTSFTYTLTPSAAQLAFGEVTHNPTSHGAQVYALYEGLLGRTPDPVGLAFWTDAFDDGAAPSTLAAGFLGSVEGQARAGALDNRAFVSQLYSATLDRAPDAAGLDFWSGVLATGASRAEVGVGFALSTEHLASLAPAFEAGIFVPDADAAAAARIYYTVLDRAPDADGLRFWTDALKAGTPLSVETASFLATPEAQARTAALTTAQYVDFVYDNALGRDPEAEGLRFWTDAIDGGVASRVDVTTAIGQSVEAQLHLAPLIEQGWHLA